MGFVTGDRGMEKLERLQKVRVVRVNGELEAAGKLAGRNASHSEATERLEQLQELAGNFRRTQLSIEEHLDDPEKVASARKVSVDFNEAYQKTKELLEKHISCSKPIRAVFGTSGAGSLLKQVQQFCALVEKWNAANVGHGGSVFDGTRNPNDIISDTKGQSGAVGCSDPDGKQLPKGAPALSGPSAPEVKSKQEDNYNTQGGQVSNSLPLQNEHLPAYRVSTFHPIRANKDGNKGGPETSSEGVEMALGVDKAIDLSDTLHPVAERYIGTAQEHPETSGQRCWKRGKESQGAQRKAHILPTEPDSVWGIDVDLSQASLDSKVCMSHPSGNEIVTRANEQAETVCFEEQLERDHQERRELAQLKKKLQPEDNIKNDRKIGTTFTAADGEQAQVSSDLTESFGKFFGFLGCVVRFRLKDHTFSFKELWIRERIRLIIGIWEHQVKSLDTGEGKGLQLKIRHTTVPVEAVVSVEAYVPQGGGECSSGSELN